MTATSGEGSVQGDDSLSFRTKDGVEGKMDISLTFRLNGEQAVKFHRNYGMDNGSFAMFIQRIIRQNFHSTPRQQVAGMNADFLRTEKGLTAVEERSERVLKQQTQDTGVEIMRVHVRQVRFKRRLSAGARAQAGRAEAHRRRGQRPCRADSCTGRADAKHIEAKAQADANNRIAQSLSPAVLESRRIDALHQAKTIYVGDSPALTREIEGGGQQATGGGGQSGAAGQEATNNTTNSTANSSEARTVTVFGATR